MKVFSDTRILFNTICSYGTVLLYNYKSRKHLNRYLKKYSEIYGVELVAGQADADYDNLVEIDLIAVNSAADPIAIYMDSPYASIFWAEKHKKFLDAYRKGEWKAARFYINGIPSVASSGLRDAAWHGRLQKYYEYMLSRMEGEAPDNWDGVHRLF